MIPETCKRAPHAEFTAELPLPPKALSPNKSGTHWAVRARATKKYREDCAWAFKAAMPKSWIKCAVAIRVEYRAPKGCNAYVAHDVANAMSSLKAGIDGAIDAGVIPSDGRRWLSWESMDLITTKKELAGRAPGVSIFVRAI